MRLDYPEIRANMAKPQTVVEGHAICRCTHPVRVSASTTVYHLRGQDLDFSRPIYVHPGCLASRDAELRRVGGMDATRPAGSPRPGAARLRHRKSRAGPRGDE